MTRVPRLAAGLLAMAAACSFERRPDRAPDPDPANGRAEAAAVDSVAAVVSAFHAAVVRGDLARAATYLHPDAEMYDVSVGAVGAPALGVIAGDRALGHWSADLSTLDAVLLGDAAMVVGALDAVDPNATEPLYGVETVLLVRSTSGWMIRHIHRSATSGG